MWLVVMIDARRGVLTQSKRHSYLASLIGIRKIVLAVNKMDLMGYSEKIFNDIVADYREFAKKINLEDITAIPMMALRGDNITEQSEHMPWYRGTTLMGYLETVEIDEGASKSCRFVCLCNGSIAPTSIFAALRAALPAARFTPETASASCA